MTQLKFHLALNVSNVEQTLTFYKEVLGLYCKRVNVKGRQQIYVNFFGNNLAFEEKKEYIKLTRQYSTQEALNMMANREVPEMHFGVFELSYDTFFDIIEHLKLNNINFLIQPTLCDKDKPSEQMFAFIQDPEGYIIELRALKTQYSFDKQEDWIQQDEQKIIEPIIPIA